MELPETGAAALSEGDLQRDTRRLSEVSGEAREERLHRRFQEMRLSPVFGRRWSADGVSCGLREGGDAPAVVIIAIDDRSSVIGGAAPAAALISLAKVTDHARPAEPWLYCDVTPEALAGLVAAPPVSAGRVVVLGPLDDGPFEVTRSEVIAVAATDRSERTADGLDYRAMRERLERLHRLTRE